MSLLTVTTGMGVNRGLERACDVNLSTEEGENMNLSVGNYSPPVLNSGRNSSQIFAPPSWRVF